MREREKKRKREREEEEEYAKKKRFKKESFLNLIVCMSHQNIINAFQTC